MLDIYFVIKCALRSRWKVKEVNYTAGSNELVKKNIRRFIASFIFPFKLLLQI